MQRSGQRCTERQGKRHWCTRRQVEQVKWVTQNLVPRLLRDPRDHDDRCRQCPTGMSSVLRRRPPTKPFTPVSIA